MKYDYIREKVVIGSVWDEQDSGTGAAPADVACAAPAAEAPEPFRQAQSQ